MRTRIPAGDADVDCKTDLPVEAKRTAGTRAMARQFGTSAHGARPREPRVALAFWKGHRDDHGQLRRARGSSVPSRVARLARAPLHRGRLVGEGSAPAHYEFSGVSAR